MALYQSYDQALKHENVALVNPSREAWRRIKEAFPDGQAGVRPTNHWTILPLVVFQTLTAQWTEYTTALHQVVRQIKNDTAFAQVESRGKTKLPIDTLREAMEYGDLLQHASHVLQNNIEILTAVQSESSKRQQWSTPIDPGEEMQYEAFRSGLEDTIRELQFAQHHVQLIRNRLQGSAVRDVVTLQNSYTMERMTARSILEARAVRIIALVTLLYLPPSFTAALFGMGYLHTSMSTRSAMHVRADADFWFYVAITLPLMLVTLLAFFAWDRVDRRRFEQREGSGQAQGDVEMGILNLKPWKPWR
ncbi:hypothetical protein LTR15_011908 [Elasticomyces elasticus]|nr:hypothetical protein LTR15_011908 [Elasticomyces elasticus]